MSPAPALQVYTSPTRTMADGKSTFSPITSTLVLGESEAVLVDSQFVDEDIDAVGDLIERSGRRLQSIIATHAHPDHYLGAGRLIQRFPGARALSTEAVAAAVEASQADQLRLSRQLLGDVVTTVVALPEALDGDTLEVDGHELRLIEVGQGDIAPSVVVHVPELDAVIAGDVAYNGIHPMLAYSSPPQWEQWIASLDSIEALRPSTVVAGHKQPDASDEDVEAIIGGTRAYIRDFAGAVEGADSAREVVEAMRERYPDHGNLTTLIVSAQAAVAVRPPG